MADSQSPRSTGYESGLERDFIKHLLFNQNVSKHEEQPLTIEFTDRAGIHRRYTPDLFVSYRKDLALTKNWRPLLVEVKYRSDLFTHWSELKPKFRAARAFAAKRCWDFAIITERELRTPYLKNITFLLEFGKYPADELVSEGLLDALTNNASTTPSTLLDWIAADAMQKANWLPILWRLIATGRIAVDLEQRLTMNSRIWLKVPSERRKYNEPNARFRSGSSRRKRWQALRYYPHSES
ncbi:MAG TPA: heteromeric transposase endonuclease subunit TnsA [Candidatus Dormibacteraeota bacterium]|nr:heteromeric transposase endonuclease subunit TnsA [Candidatus Dormibacteraeota bacterium]